MWCACAATPVPHKASGGDTSAGHGVLPFLPRRRRRRRSFQGRRCGDLGRGGGSTGTKAMRSTRRCTRRRPSTGGSVGPADAPRGRRGMWPRAREVGFGAGRTERSRGKGKREGTDGGRTGGRRRVDRRSRGEPEVAEENRRKEARGQEVAESLGGCAGDENVA